MGVIVTREQNSFSNERLVFIYYFSFLASSISYVIGLIDGVSQPQMFKKTSHNNKPEFYKYIECFIFLRV